MCSLVTAFCPYHYHEMYRWCIFDKTIGIFNFNFILFFASDVLCNYCCCGCFPRVSCCVIHVCVIEHTRVCQTNAPTCHTLMHLLQWDRRWRLYSAVKPSWARLVTPLCRRAFSTNQSSRHSTHSSDTATPGAASILTVVTHRVTGAC